MERHLKILGLYISVVAIAHLCLYVVLDLFSVSLAWLFYFDTRIGLFFAETGIKYSAEGGSEGTPPALTAWLVEIILLAIGVSMLAGKRLLKTYIVVEGLLTISYLLFFLLIMAAGMSANHGFSPAELFLPSAVVIVCCLLPLVYATWILWSFRSKSNLSLV